MADGFLGEIRMFAGSYAPYKWTFCYGQLLPIAGNEGLYSLLGTAYGGDGRASFGLPDFRGRIPVHQGTGDGLTPRVMGQMYGTEKVSLELSQIPNHSHVIKGSNSVASSTVPMGRVLATSPSETFYDDGSVDKKADLDQGVILNAGGDASHLNLQPFLCLQFIICINGTYPQRN